MARYIDMQCVNEKCPLLMVSNLTSLLQQIDMAKPINEALLEVYNPLYEENNLLRLAIEDIM
jgi:hypothetical protein